VDDAVRAYVEGVPAEHRALFDRVHGLILATRPDAAVTISYGIPTYKLGGQRLYLGAWKHGVSLYGWGQDRDGGFCARHPDLVTGKGTIRLRPDDAATITDAELRSLVEAALAV
jgi:uncharacterized protein YdhG (YjbR/CyaY superfamily)